MIEDSSNSMVNMAITMDPFSAEQKLRKMDQQILQKQKDKLLGQMGDVNDDKYSDDAFEKDD